MQVILGTRVIKIAGEAWDIDPVNLVSVFTSEKTIAVGSIIEFVYLSGYVYYNTSLFSFDGGSIMGSRSQQLVYPDRPARCVPWRGLHSALLARHCFYCGVLRAERDWLLLRGIRQHRGLALPKAPPSESAIPVPTVPSATPTAPASACSAPQATPALSVAVSPPTPR